MDTMTTDARVVIAGLAGLAVVLFSLCSLASALVFLNTGQADYVLLGSGFLLGAILIFYRGLWWAYQLGTSPDQELLEEPS